MRNLVRMEISKLSGGDVGSLVANGAIDELQQMGVDLGDESVNRALKDEGIRRGIVEYVGRYVRAALRESSALASLKIDLLNGPVDTGVNVASLAVVPCRALTAEDRLPGAREDHPDATEIPHQLLDEQCPLVIHVHGGIVEGKPNPAMLVHKIRGMSALAIASGGEDGDEVNVCLDRVADGIATNRSLTGGQIPLSVGRPELIKEQNMVLVFPGHILDEVKFAQSRLGKTDKHGKAGPTPASVVFCHILKSNADTARFENHWVY